MSGRLSAERLAEITKQGRNARDMATEDWSGGVRYMARQYASAVADLLDHIASLEAENARLKAEVELWANR